jgi:hypothetical protein
LLFLRRHETISQAAADDRLTRAEYDSAVAINAAR